MSKTSEKRARRAEVSKKEQASDKFRNKVVIGGVILLALLGALGIYEHVSGENSLSQTGAGSARSERLVFSGPGDSSAEVRYLTSRPLKVDSASYDGLVNLYRLQGGKLPASFRIMLTDQDVPNMPADVYGMTDPVGKNIFVNLKAAFGVNFIYPPLAVVNGALTGETCNLMFNEAQQLPGGKGSFSHIALEQMCDSLATMSAGIVAGRSYDQYREDLTTRLVNLQPANGFLSYDLETFRKFQKTLSQPLIVLN